MPPGQEETPQPSNMSASQNDGVQRHTQDMPLEEEESDEPQELSALASIFKIRYRNVVSLYRARDHKYMAAAKALLEEPEIPIWMRAKLLMFTATDRGRPYASVELAQNAVDMLDQQLRSACELNGEQFPEKQLTAAKKFLVSCRERLAQYEAEHGNAGKE